MKLYSLHFDAEYLLGNGEPQVIALSDDILLKSFTKGFPEVTEPIRYKLHKRAVVTNCLSQRSIISAGFLIDGKVKALFDTFRLIEHQYYPVEITGKNSQPIEDYHWLKVEEDLTEEIDYKTSIFYETNGISKVGEIKIDSYNFYTQQKAEKGWRFDMEAKEIKLRSNSKLIDYDLFRLFPFESKVLISEPLKNAIEQINLTGFIIEEYNKIKFHN